MTIAARIVSTGLGVPSKLVTNKDFEKMVDTNDEWIVTRTGIRERRFLDRENGEYLETICIRAGQQALERAGLKPSDIELVICCTTSPDTFLPNTSARLTESLGLVNAAAFDLNAACAGFVTGLHTADVFIRSGEYKKILLFGADALSGALNFKDRTTSVLFGDGAGAVIIEAVENPNPEKDSMILGSRFYTTFDKKGSLCLMAGASRTPFWHEDYNTKIFPYITMNGQDVFKEASRSMMQAAQDVLKKCNVSAADVKWFVPHQANLRIIEMVARLLDFPMERVYVNVDRWGNTSAATVPTCLAEMEEKGLLKRGDLVLMDVFGGGFTYGATLARW
ncbi:MAG: ketoacyl-ACP synthase III [Proteobacteria bacterium]|nr:ketoacyl-ACP synthase III [Pseudomonadota bacterium]